MNWAQLQLAWLSWIGLGSAETGLAGLVSAALSTAGLGCNWLDAATAGHLVWLDWALRLAQLGSTRLGLATIGWAGLGSAELSRVGQGLAWLELDRLGSAGTDTAEFSWACVEGSVTGSAWQAWAELLGLVSLGYAVLGCVGLCPARLESGQLCLAVQGWAWRRWFQLRWARSGIRVSWLKWIRMGWAWVGQQLGKKTAVAHWATAVFLFLFFLVSNCSFFTIKSVKKLQLLTYFFWSKDLSVGPGFRLAIINDIIRRITNAENWTWNLPSPCA